MKIALVSCVSKKHLGTHPAEDLYCSNWFEKAKKHVKENYSHWYILSAKYGLLLPEAIVESYDTYLPETSLEYRRQWAHDVFNSIKRVNSITTEINIFAGVTYRKYLVPLLETAGYKVNIPLSGLGIGQQLRWFIEHTNDYGN